MIKSHIKNRRISIGQDAIPT